MLRPAGWRGERLPSPTAPGITTASRRKRPERYETQFATYQSAGADSRVARLDFTVKNQVTPGCPLRRYSVTDYRLSASSFRERCGSLRSPGSCAFHGPTTAITGAPLFGASE